MSSYLNNTDRGVVARKKIASGVLQRLFIQNRDVDVILTSKNDASLSEYLTTLDQTLENLGDVDSFSVIKINDELSLIANGKSDTLAIIPGSGIEITGDTENGSSITFAMSQSLLEKLDSIDFDANNYEHPTYPNVPPGENYIRVSVDECGHVYAASKTPMTITEGGTGAATAEEARIALGAASTDEASADAAGLMSSEMFNYITELMSTGPSLSEIPASYVHGLFPELYPESSGE